MLRTCRMVARKKTKKEVFPLRETSLNLNLKPEKKDQLRGSGKSVINFCAKYP